MFTIPKFLSIAVLSLGYLSAPGFWSDGAAFASETYSERERDSDTDELIKQVKDLTGYNKLMDRGTAIVEFVLASSKWSNTNISVSFMPDGTAIYTDSSGLFSLLSSTGSPATWQREYARALARWAAITPLNFHIVADSGAAEPGTGAVQGNPNFGDIRCGSRPDTPYIGGRTYYPSATSAIGGDLFLNTTTGSPYKIGEWLDIFTVVLHESGHSLGLKESTVYPSAMYGTIIGTNTTGLYQDDIDGIQAIYGPRLPDQYDTVASNDTPETASPIAVTPSGQTFIDGDLTTTADLDYYVLTVPAGAAPVLSVTAENSRSLLQPRLKVFDAFGTLLGEASAADYGQGALLQVSDAFQGEELIIGVDSPVKDEFGSGVYRLAVEFRSTQDGVAYVPPAMQNPDAYEVNDSLAVATNLGQTSSKTTTGLNIHWAWDEDFFKFTTVNSAVKNYEVSVAYTSGTAPLAIEIFNAAGAKIAQSNGATFVRFPVVKNTAYSIRVYCPTHLVRGYNLMVKNYK